MVAVTLLAMALAACWTVEVTPNRPPVAFAGFARQAVVGRTVVLDGTPSRDPDGDRLTYSWAAVAFPEGAERPTPSTGALLSFQPGIAGLWVFRLVVDDGSLRSRPSLVGVMAGSSSPTAAPIVLLNGPRVVSPGLQVTIEAGVLVGGLPSADATVDWGFYGTLPPGGLITLTASGPRKILFAPPGPGHWTISARATAGGTLGLTSLHSIEVVGKGGSVADHPVAEVGPRPAKIARTDPRRVALGSSVALDGSASRPGRWKSISTWSWSLVQWPAGSAGPDALFAGPDTPSSTASFKPDAAGDYVVSLKVGGPGKDEPLSAPDLIAFRVHR